MQIRTLHAYLGMLITPSMLFFAFTGLLQIFSLHEAHGGYTPPRFIEMLSAVHKDQRMGTKHREPPAQARSANSTPTSRVEEPHRAGAQGAHIATDLLKIFFASVAIGLIVSTSLGVWMALQNARRRRLYVALLLTGTILPVFLAMLTG